VDRSQEAGARLLGNQIPETLSLATLARRLGAAAASAFGAGFGGSVWALVARNEGADFLRRWQSAYEASFPDRAPEARFFVTRPAPAAFEIEVYPTQR
jgi:galactokinase